MKKKCILTLVLIFICIAILGTVTVSAATSGTCGANLNYKIENGTLTISGTGEMTKALANLDSEIKKLSQILLSKRE